MKFSKLSDKNKGIIFIVLSSFFFALMSLFVRLAGDLPVMQKSFFRNLIAVLFAAIVLFRERPEIKLDKGDWNGLLLRSIFGTIGILCNYYAVDHLMLADASILNKTAPFVAVLMGALILGEKLKGFHIAVVCCAFGGALMVVKPGSGILAMPALVGLIGGVMAGTAYTMVRYLGKRNVPGPFIVFFFSAFSCIVLSPLMLLDFKPMSMQQLVFLLLAGLSAAIAQFSVTAAYCHAPSREISVFDYSQIIFSALMGFVVFGQVPDLLSWLGYGVILCAAIANFVYNNRKTA